MNIPHNSLAYRPDIDGLRAIAVLSVVMFHFNIGPFRGGFAGVDVFFVISGYLITGIIHREVVMGNFTFAGFYERRVRRIFPALFAMLLLVLVAGPFLLLPSDLERLSGSVIATLLFVSNILFWRNSGYFDASSLLNPLLHTWSLAVEEQFYIGFPIFMLLIERYARRQIVPLLVLVGSVSFILCVYYQPLRPTATFYLSPFRAWELVLGALLGVGAVPAISHRLTREAIAGCGLMMLVASLMLLQEGPSFPGWIVSFPVVATAILLHTGTSGESLARRMLELKPMVVIGLISYSLYLWHWPLVVYARYVNGIEPLPAILAYGLFVQAMLWSWISYRWVEMPFRLNRVSIIPKTRKILVAGTLACMAALSLIAASLKIDKGWQHRFAPVVTEFDQQRYPEIPFQACDSYSPRLNDNVCIGGQQDSPNSIFLWGDSHALAWAPAVDEIGKRVGMKVILAPNSACPPLFDVINPIDPSCVYENDHIRAFIQANKPDVVIMVASWLSYSIPHGFYALEDRQGRTDNGQVFAPALQRTISELQMHVGRIILIGPTPGAPGDAPFRMAISEWLGKLKPLENTTSKVRQQDGWFWKEAHHLDGGDQLRLVDPVDWFCDSRSCRYIDERGRLLYRDASHLSQAGASFVAERFPKDLLQVKFRGDHPNPVDLTVPP